MVAVRIPLSHYLASVVALVAACDPVSTPGPTVRAFRFTAPATPVELVPIAGDWVDCAWTYDVDYADQLSVTVQAVPTAGEGGSAWLASVPLASGSALYVVPATTAWVPPLNVIPAGVYQLVATVYDDGASAVLAEATAPGLLVVQGVRFRDAELTFTADVARRDIWMTTVTATVALATVSLTPAAGGTRQVISQATIASDLAPVGRVITFTGHTLDDVAIPAGDYPAVVEIRARGGTVTYERGGLTIHWQP